MNIPVNAISATSGSHLRDKLTTLGTLLSGNHGRITATHHPAGVAFCKDLFAKKIVVSNVNNELKSCDVQGKPHDNLSNE